MKPGVIILIMLAWVTAITFLIYQQDDPQQVKARLVEAHLALTSKSSAYPKTLKKAVRKLKAENPNLKVVAGGERYSYKSGVIYLTPHPPGFRLVTRSGDTMLWISSSRRGTGSYKLEAAN